MYSVFLMLIGQWMFRLVGFVHVPTKIDPRDCNLGFDLNHCHQCAKTAAAISHPQLSRGSSGCAGPAPRILTEILDEAWDG